ncbi:hypothetical protein [Streptomyces sp. JJ66]|uniref:hypothetical protein n=1 Tax=Streptomyces sp. JJ66 TaxID=2803843 RepID=UPI0027E331B8|nr:hypothetical protein [Streptomyces sp. JJ66]
MSALSWVLWITVALVVTGVYLSWTAGRLDRLHARIDAARAALDAQLLRRASVAQELATSGVFDPAASMLLYQSAHDARLAAEEQREVAESELSQALRAVLGEPGQMEAVRAVPGGEESVGELAEAVRRVPMARRFHNDAVRAARALRRHRAVRWLRLAGHAPFPLAFEMDDEPPAALVDRSTAHGAPAPADAGGPSRSQPPGPPGGERERDGKGTGGDAGRRGDGAGAGH